MEVQTEEREQFDFTTTWNIQPYSYIALHSLTRAKNNEVVTAIKPQKTESCSLKTN